MRATAMHLPGGFGTEYVLSSGHFPDWLACTSRVTISDVGDREFECDAPERSHFPASNSRAPLETRLGQNECTRDRLTT